MAVSEQEALVERILRGEEAACEELVATYQGTVRGFAALWAPSRDEADDIAQEVFLAAFRGMATFDASNDLKLWLLGIARNLTRQAWRRVGRRPQGSSEEALSAMLEREALVVHAERSQAADRRQAAMRACLEKLPAHSAGIFHRFVVDEERSAEIARNLKTSDGSIRSTITRIRRGLRDCIRRRMQTEDQAWTS